jgi:hypothetical protein
MLQWIAKPSWHKLNHQNCSAACQDAKPLYDYFPLSSRHKRRSIDQSMCVRACFARGIMLAPPEYAVPEATYLGHFFCTK